MFRMKRWVAPLVAACIAVTLLTCAPAGASPPPAGVSGTAVTTSNELGTTDFSYSTAGPLGSGTIHNDYTFTLQPPGLVTSGTAVLTRSDGATLSGITTGTVDFSTLPGPLAVVIQLHLTSGTGAFADASADLTLTGMSAGPGHIGESFALAGTFAAPKTKASPPVTPNAQVKLANFTVLDQYGSPFQGSGVVSPAPFDADSGVIYCVDGQQNSCLAAPADQHGNVQGFYVNPNVKYQVFGFAKNTGWGCGQGFVIGSDDFYFGTSTVALGRQLTAPSTLVVARPTSCTEMHILNAATGAPFSPANWGTPSHVGAGMRICPVTNCIDQGLAGANVMYPGADANGDVFVANLDAGTQYTFLAMVRDIAGCTPDYTDGSSNYWFPPGGTVTGTPSDLAGTTFYIDDNCP